ncbi:LysE family translocator [Jatrophihabitans telluris]|uniref:LysE family translocator n=1 Tax=Jatrophihabitans telluris TaxID=2038343 RepID=A0ABY4R1Y3_9ACTN|nr:LysE family translocator [Jatrophihabitans telluris]UQX89840.1 LysE family translocator [Jatrophihabitans telluris]
MPIPTQLPAFIVAAVILIVVPGPSVLFVVSRALELGRGGALVTVIGNALGQFVQVVAVALGVGAVVERSITIFTVIKLVGAAYLVVLGVQALRHRRELGSILAHEFRPRPRRRIFAEGFAVGVANPKSIVFFAAVLPQFVDRAAGRAPIQMLLLGMVFLLIALVSDGAWGLAAGTARHHLARSPRRLAGLGGTGGVIMIGMGARLALTGRRD